MRYFFTTRSSYGLGHVAATQIDVVYTRVSYLAPIHYFVLFCTVPVFIRFQEAAINVSLVT